MSDTLGLHQHLMSYEQKYAPKNCVLRRIPTQPWLMWLLFTSGGCVCQRIYIMLSYSIQSRARSTSQVHHPRVILQLWIIPWQWWPNSNNSTEPIISEVDRWWWVCFFLMRCRFQRLNLNRMSLIFPTAGSFVGLHFTQQTAGNETGFKRWMQPVWKPFLKKRWLHV